jgi:cystathionine beta-lyase/cystathionine gamma-synthase
VEFETLAIHAGQEPDPATGAVIVPIYQTSTFVQEAVGRHKGYDYSRTANPTRTALETCLAALEGAEHGLAFASGMAAAATVLHLLSPGDRVVSVNDVYGGTYRLFERVYAPKGYVFEYVSAETLGTGLADALDERTRLVWIETPTNPFLRIVDVRAAARAARGAGALCVVDNTFATPYLQRPLDLGADLVLHSTTKYLGGHSDVVGGFVATSDGAVAERLRFLQNAVGAIPGPLDSWLVLRGLKTLSVRMREHCANARRVAGFLERHPKVRRVYYPGLPAHPGHDVAAGQMRDFGGMVSFEVDGSLEDTKGVAERTRIFALGESLGGVESLIEHPGLMTHATLAESPFALPGNLLRLSVGIEAVDDLVADLEQALEPLGAAGSRRNAGKRV